MGICCSLELIDRACDLCDCRNCCNENGYDKEQHFDDHTIGHTQSGWAEPSQPGIGLNPVGDDPWQTVDNTDPVWHPPSWVNSGQPPTIVSDQPVFGGIDQAPFGVGQPPYTNDQSQFTNVGQPNIGYIGGEQHGGIGVGQSNIGRY